MLQWPKHLSSLLYVGKVHCYLATKPEMENFRDQGFVLSEVEGLRVQSLWLLKKALTSREESDISRE